MFDVAYQQWWSERPTVDEFGRRIADVWAQQYTQHADANMGDLVDVDPGNGFMYTFDLAGSLTGAACGREPRVVAVWGTSRPDAVTRDVSRIRGHPRPRRRADDRGHLISCAAGGGYDINLVAMDAGLNRGHSADGRRFRDMERLAAAREGALFFVRLHYSDGSARPDSLEVGVQDADALLVETFFNPKAATVSEPSSGSALRAATPFSLDPGLVASCLDPSTAGDALFALAWRHGTRSLARSERARVAPVTGHVAESVASLLLDKADWRLLWQFAGPGLHGVDLVLATPGDKVVAVEVKGTLVPGRIPRLTRRELAQMSAEWVDKDDNPGMSNLGLDSTDVYGGVVAVNFSDRWWRVALTDDFVAFRPVLNLGELTSL